MSEMFTTTIDPDNYNSRDIEYLSDMICEILTEKHGRLVGSLSFSIEVSYTLEDEEDAA